MRERTGLWAAAFVACGMFLAEDPAIIAVRQHLRRNEPAGLGAGVVDVVLGLLMVTYNVAAIRYVVRVASADVIEQAIGELATERRHHRRLDAVARVLNPFNLIKAFADRAGGAIERAGEAARRHGRVRVARLLGDVAVVNLLGVPGAGIQRSATGRTLGGADAIRLSVLFVVSWFAGAWAIELAIGAADGWPVVGGALGAGWRGIATSYATITDVTAPVGAACVTVFAAAVVRAVSRVDRRARLILARSHGSG